MEGSVRRERSFGTAESETLGMCGVGFHIVMTGKEIFFSR